VAPNTFTGSFRCSNSLSMLPVGSWSYGKPSHFVAGTQPEPLRI